MTDREETQTTTSTAETRRDLRSAATSGAAWSLLRASGSRVLSLVVFLVLARLLAPDDFGVIAVASTFTALLNVLVEGGVTVPLVRRSSLRSQAVSTAFWLSVGSGLILSLGLAAVSPVLAAGFDAPLLRDVILFLSLGMVIAASSSVPNALLTRDLKFKQIAVRGLLATCISGAVGVAVAVGGGGVYALVSQALVYAGVSAVLTWRACRWRPAFVFDRREAVSLVTEGSSPVASQLLHFIDSRCDEVIVAAILGVRAAGVLAVAKRLLLVITDLTVSVGTSLALPAFSRLVDDRSRLTRAYTEARQVLAVLSVTAMGALAVTSYEVVPVVFGSQWSDAGVVAGLLAVAALLGQSTAFDRSLQFSLNRGGSELANTLVQTASKVVVTLVAAPFGLVLLAAAEIVRNVPLVWLRAITTARALQVRARSLLAGVWRPYVASLPAALSAVGVIVACSGQRWVPLLSGGVFVVGYLVTLRLMAKRELSAVLRALPASSATRRIAGLKAGT